VKENCPKNPFLWTGNDALPAASTSLREPVHSRAALDYGPQARRTLTTAEREDGDRNAKYGVITALTNLVEIMPAQSDNRTVNSRAVEYGVG
jgi:hypothetical protein